MYKSSDDPWEHCREGYTHIQITCISAIKYHVHLCLGLDSVRDQKETAVDRSSCQSILVQSLRISSHEYLGAEKAKNEFCYQCTYGRAVDWQIRCFVLTCKAGY